MTHPARRGPILLAITAVAIVLQARVSTGSEAAATTLQAPPEACAKLDDPDARPPL